MVNLAKKIIPKKIILILIMLIAITTLTTLNVKAQTLEDVPILPSSFYGESFFFNGRVGFNVPIRVYDSEGFLCGSFNTFYSGKFGILNCIAKNTTPDGPGGTPGETITFRIGIYPTSVLLDGTLASIGNVTWQSGTFQNITIVAPPIVCGDKFCDRFETCQDCPEDCGECKPPPTTPSQPGGTGGAGDPNLGGLPEPGVPMPPIPEEKIEECAESWSCTEWSTCLPSNYQQRICVDNNKCGTEEEKPEETRYCLYFDVTDRNVTPRDPSDRPREEIPGLIARCTERLTFLSLPSLLFLLLTLIILIVPYIRYKHIIKKLNKDKKTDELITLQKKYVEKRKITIYALMVITLSIIVYLYHFFFFLCKEVYIKNLWLLGVFVFVSPFIVHTILIILKYSEKDKEIMIKMFNDTHYMHILTLIKATNRQILEAESQITHDIYALNKREEFHELLINTEPIKQLYKDMLKLYDVYKFEKTSIKTEKDLLENITKLDQDQNFNDAILDHPELNQIKNSLTLLYKSYEHKQELYDELARIEKEYYEEEHGITEEQMQAQAQKPKETLKQQKEAEEQFKEQKITGMIQELKETQKDTEKEMNKDKEEKKQMLQEFSEEPEKEPVKEPENKQ